MIGSTFKSFGKYLVENIYETKLLQENFLLFKMKNEKKTENFNFKDQ